MSRLSKQIIIAAVFFIIVGLIIYFSFVKNALEPTTPPAVSIQPLEISSQKLLKVSNLDYDFLVEIRNPNTDFGAAEVSYELNLFGQNGELVALKSGSISLLPGQTRYEIISSLIVDREIFNAVFRVSNASWEKLSQFIPQNLFLVKNQEYLKIKPPEQGYSKLKGTLFNNSNFDFDRVDIHIVLFDGAGIPIAVNKTDVRTFLAKTDRFFEVKWLNSFSGLVARVEINAYTNVFQNKNFIKVYGTQEKFQKFY